MLYYRDCPLLRVVTFVIQSFLSGVGGCAEPGGTGKKSDEGGAPRREGRGGR
jgi:hypothetical protein